jgi:hypothetical protein
MGWFLTSKEDVVRMAFFKDATIQFDAVKPLGQKEGFLITQGLAEEGIILPFTRVTIAQNDHGARVFSPNLIKDALKVENLLAYWDWIIPSDLKTFFACFKASPTGRRSSACSSSTATAGAASAAGSTAAAGRRGRCRGSASASLRNSPSGSAHKSEGNRKGSKFKKVFPHRGNPYGKEVMKMD